MRCAEAVHELNNQHQIQQALLLNQLQTIEALQQQNESLQSQLDEIKLKVGMD